jgi:hypothetical protein
MQKVNFIDPYAAQTRSSMTWANARRSASTPSESLEGTAVPSPRRGREHEVRRVIKDLAALAARNKKRQAD